MNALSLLMMLTMIVWPETTSPGEPDSSDVFKNYITTNHKRSYITVLEGIGNVNPLYFEAAVSPYYLLRLKDEYRWAIELSPKMVLRMKREASFPIRTPSYMPRITYYHLLKNTFNGDKELIPYVSVVHHSNGQNGEFYNNDGSVNTQSGNFSTNYVEIGAFMSQLPTENGRLRTFYKSFLEYHFAPEPHLKDLYGSVRLNFDFQLIHQLTAYANKKGKARKKAHAHRIRQSFHAGWILGPMRENSPGNMNRRFNLKYTLSYHPKIAEDMSVFLQFYHGQDYYNISFINTINVLRFGLMTDQLKFW